MSEKSTADKLLLKPGRSLKLINAPDGFIEVLGELPAFAKVVELSEPADVVQLFINSYADLESQLSSAYQLLQPNSIFWICYPKKSGSIKTDIDRDILYEYASLRNLKGIGMISLDDNWSAMRFKNE